MRSFRNYIVVIAASMSALAAMRLPASSAGPLPGHTGGFGEPDCGVCHFDYPLNESGATIRLDSLPAAYVPERKYTLRLLVRHPELERGGFQLTARFENGSAAGLFEIGDTALLRVQKKDGIDYLSHTLAGTDQVLGDSIVWNFDWVAPRSGRLVVFSLAVNVANRDASALGDRIYTKAFQTGGERVRK